MKTTTAPKYIIPLLICILFLSFNAYGAQFPSPTGHVNDFAGVMSQATKQGLEPVLASLKNQTGAEIAVVTVSNMGGMDETTYAVGLFETWGIGSKERDDGLLILVAVEERRLRIEVGYGLEGIIPDAAAGQIRDRYMVPHLKQNDYDTGILQGTLAAASLIAEAKGVELGVTAPSPPSARSDRKGGRLGALINLIVIIVVLIMLSGRRGGGGLLTGLLLGSMMGGGRRYHDSGFGGGFGGGGGGFGGFGGGFSGGGGASGGF